MRCWVTSKHHCVGCNLAIESRIRNAAQGQIASEAMLGCYIAGLRVMEVRLAYASEDFEWENTKRLCLKDLTQSNTQVLQRHAEVAFTRAMNADSASGRELPDTSDPS